MKIRKANVKDVSNIQKLINYYAGKDEMLPRSLNDIYENLRDYWVCEDKGSIIGCGALHVVWEDLAEAKSLAVDEKYKKMGIGNKILKECIENAKELGVSQVFALSYVPAFFKKYGFKEIHKDKLPHKIWSECIKCPKFPDCGEVSLLYNI